jgi:hypothetical protein
MTDHDGMSTYRQIDSSDIPSDAYWQMRAQDRGQHVDVAYSTGQKFEHAPMDGAAGDERYMRCTDLSMGIATYWERHYD